jgi:hypothetical protein
VADLDLVRGLYHQLSPALQAIALKPGGIQYHAHSVIRSEIFQLTRRGDPERYLHLLAFIAHQYYRLQDKLVDVLLARDLYLSQKLEEIEDAATRQVFLDAVAHGSVISWQHINLLGEYDFSDEKLQDNVGIRPPKLTP